LICADVVEARGCVGAADTTPACPSTDPSVILPLAALVVLLGPEVNRCARNRRLGDQQQWSTEDPRVNRDKHRDKLLSMNASSSVPACTAASATNTLTEPQGPQQQCSISVLQQCRDSS
jgi:hypothetical protein